LGHIALHDRPAPVQPAHVLCSKLDRALMLFERVLKLNPSNWQAMWFSGKIQQRLGDYTAALAWFERTYQVNPSKAASAQEATTRVQPFALFGALLPWTS